MESRDKYVESGTFRVTSDVEWNFSFRMRSKDLLIRLSLYIQVIESIQFLIRDRHICLFLEYRKTKTPEY